MATVVFGAFEWDDRKAVINLNKHGVSFEEALTALADPNAIEAPDLADAARRITIGYSALWRVLFVVHTEVFPSGRTRIISARKATTVQRRKYEEAGLIPGSSPKATWTATTGAGHGAAGWREKRRERLPFCGYSSRTWLRGFQTLARPTRRCAPF